MEEVHEFPIYQSPPEIIEQPIKKYTDRCAALVCDTLVVNRIVVQENDNGVVEFELAGHEIIVIPDDSPVGAGWIYFEGEFFAPPPEEPVDESELPLSE